LAKSIAFFDFDGTITTHDSMLELARFSAGSLKYVTGMCLLSPWLVAMKLSLLSKKTAKEKLLRHFFGGMPIKKFEEHCLLFTMQRLPSIIKKEAMAAIQLHLSAQTPVVVVSASAENWVAPWCQQNNLQFIATRLELKNDQVTGKLSGENCNGNEKVSRIKEMFNLADFSNVYCYGDTSGDKMMLQMGTHPFYRCYQ